MERENRKDPLEVICANPVTFLETLTTINRKPTLLYPKQKEYLLDPARFRIVLKARQSGFSKCLTGEAFWASVVQPKNIPEEILFISVGERQAKRLLSKHFYDWLDGMRIRNRPKLKRRTKLECVFKNGSRVVSLPNNPRTIRGYSPTRIYIDEYAHFINPEEIMTALGPSLSHGGDLTIPSTPAGKVGMFYDVWRGAIKDENPFSHHKVMWYDVPKYMKEYHETVQLMKSILPKIAFQQEYCCMFVSEGRSPFPMSLLLPCINKHSSNPKQTLSGKYYTTLGMDLARKNDKTVIIVTEHMPLDVKDRKKGDLYPYKRVVRHISCPDYSLFSTQLNHLDTVIECYKPNKVYFDESGLGARIGEELYEKYGRRVQGVIFTNKSKYDMALDLIRAFEDKKIEIPYEKTLIYQLQTMQRKILPSGRIRYKGDEDDFVWALALAVSGQRASSPMMAVETDEGIKIIGKEYQ